MNSFFGNPLVKKIQNWKDHSSVRRHNNDPLTQDEWEQKAIKSLVKKLKGKGSGERAVKELERALETRDKHTKCVTIPRSVDGRLQISSKKGLPHVIYCRIFRFPDLLSHTQLRSADTCANGYHARKPVVCVNPFHYDRTPGPPILNPVLVPSPPAGIQYPSHPGTPAMFVNSVDSEMPENIELPLDLADLDLGSPFSADSEGGGSTGSGSVHRNSDSTGSSHSSSDSTGSNVAWNLETSASQNSVFGYTSYSSAVDSYFYNSNDAYQTSSSFFQIAAENCASGAAFLADRQQMMGTYAAYSQAELRQVSLLPAGYGPKEMELSHLTAEAAPVSYVEPEFWCSVTYMEMALRVGETFHASLPILTVDGYTDPTCQDRFCVGLLSNVVRDSVTENVRRHIGKGLRLCYVGGEVFVECESESAVFVQSTNYNERNNLDANKVVKVPPGSTIMIFNNQEFAAKLANTVYGGFEAVYKLIANCNVRISFVKGWGGPFYQRPDVKHTPCWIDITLNGPLQWLDKVLTQMGSPSTICTSYS